jgi:hypothetical protein
VARAHGGMKEEACPSERDTPPLLDTDASPIDPPLRTPFPFPTLHQRRSGRDIMGVREGDEEASSERGDVTLWGGEFTGPLRTPLLSHLLSDFFNLGKAAPMEEQRVGQEARYNSLRSKLGINKGLGTGRRKLQGMQGSCM